MPYVQTVYVNKAELTDEEVWLRAYCASMSNSIVNGREIWNRDANMCLQDFNKKFK